MYKTINNNDNNINETNNINSNNNNNKLADRPTEVKLGVYINSFYSISEQTMVRFRFYIDISMS